MEFKDLEDLIKSRKSIRRWQDKPVPEDLLLKAVELATWAPNGGNLQNWYFYIITDKTTINAIAVASSRYQSIADRLFEKREKMDPKAKEMREWRNVADSRIQSTSAGVAYLLLILHQMGLGATWMTGPIQAAGAIEKILKVKPGWELVTFIPVGYPDDQPRPRDRKPVGEVTEVI